MRTLRSTKRKRSIDVNFVIEKLGNISFFSLLEQTHSRTFNVRTNQLLHKWFENKKFVTLKLTQMRRRDKVSSRRHSTAHAPKWGVRKCCSLLTKTEILQWNGRAYLKHLAFMYQLSLRKYWACFFPHWQAQFTAQFTASRPCNKTQIRKVLENREKFSTKFLHN